MRIKKWNAALSLLTMLLMLVHMGYNAYCYLTFYYNPTVKLWIACPFFLAVALHALCGMKAVFLQGDGMRPDPYPRQNARTVVQRVSAALILPLLLLHLHTFDLLRSAAGNGRWVSLGLLIFAQTLFYGTIVVHIVTSLSRALITLGLLSSREAQRRIDRIVLAAGAVLFVAAACAVVKGQLAMIPMFLSQGGAQ